MGRSTNPQRCLYTGPIHSVPRATTRTAEDTAQLPLAKHSGSQAIFIHSGNIPSKNKVLGDLGPG